MITFLADDRAPEEVVLGPDGVASRLAQGGVHLPMSTIARRLVDAHAERGAAYVAAPVFGRPDAAASGLILLARASEDAMDGIAIKVEPGPTDETCNVTIALNNIEETFEQVPREPRTFADVLNGTISEREYIGSGTFEMVYGQATGLIVPQGIRRALHAGTILMVGKTRATVQPLPLFSLPGAASDLDGLVGELQAKRLPQRLWDAFAERGSPLAEPADRVTVAAKANDHPRCRQDLSDHAQAGRAVHRPGLIPHNRYENTGRVPVGRAADWRHVGNADLLLRVRLRAARAHHQESAMRVPRPPRGRITPSGRPQRAVRAKFEPFNRSTPSVPIR